MNQIAVDARGLRCPLPVIRLAEAARDAPAGTRITVLTSDPAARHDIPAWCRMRGHELVEMTEESEASDLSRTNTASSGTDAAPAKGATASRGSETAPAKGAETAYLRFDVVLGSQRSKAAGAGNHSARSSRAT